jgi:threonine synthase
MSYHLRCRVCEDVQPPSAADACVRCDGPTDVTYDWPSLTITRASVAEGPRTLWRYGALLPAGARIDVGAGWTPLTRSDELSELLGVDLFLKLEQANPTRSYKDRVATIAVSAALDHGVTTLCCSSTGNLGDAVAAAAAQIGLEAVVLVPEGSPSAALSARKPGVHVLAVRGTYDDCRRLELELASLFPWGFVSGNLHPYASEGAKTISFEIAEQLDWQLPDAVAAPAASGTLFAKLTQGFAEVVRAGLAAEPVPRMLAAQALGSSPIADAFADDRRVSRVRAQTHVASLAVGDPAQGELALGAARATGGAVVAFPEDEIHAYTEFLSELTGVAPDPAGGAALGAVMSAARRGELARGSRVVLVVTGARPDAPLAQGSAVTTVDPNPTDVLAALGLGS